MLSFSLWFEPELGFLNFSKFLSIYFEFSDLLLILFNFFSCTKPIDAFISLILKLYPRNLCVPIYHSMISRDLLNFITFVVCVVFHPRQWSYVLLRKKKTGNVTSFNFFVVKFCSMCLCNLRLHKIYFFLQFSLSFIEQAEPPKWTE